MLRKSGDSKVNPDHIVFFIFIYVYSGLAGLIIGSFLNVVIWRLPRGQSLVQPPSSCPVCGHRLHARDLVPVFSWFLLRRRCRYCGARISARYPAVEAATGALYVLTLAGYGLTWIALAGMIVLPALLALGLILLDAARVRTGAERSGRVLGAVSAFGVLVLFLMLPWLGV